MLQVISSLDHQEETRILVTLVMTWYHLIAPVAPHNTHLGMWSTSWHVRVATRSPTPAHHTIHHVITTSTGGMCGEEDEQGG